MEGHHHNIHHHQQQQQQQLHHHQQYHHIQQQQQVTPPSHQQMMGGGGGGGATATAPAGADTAGDRFPQWSVQETKEFLIIRADLDRNFMETKRNKLLWEVISTKMRDKGFFRSAEQCKCKWKNLVTRYKGCETMEPEAMRQQFPFYNEMQAIFTSRMQRMLWAEEESGPGPSKKNKMGPGANVSSDEEEEQEEGDSDGGENKGGGSSHQRARRGGTSSKKARIGGGGGGASTSSVGVQNNNNPNNNVSSSINAMKEMLEEFMRQQMQADAQWREAYEAREEERRRAEMEWRQRMEALENERLVMDRRWREIQEQRKLREEARAEKRDALITTLLNKLRREDSH